jgi:hypothetical protein
MVTTFPTTDETYSPVGGCAVVGGAPTVIETVATLPGPPAFTA